MAWAATAQNPHVSLVEADESHDRVWYELRRVIVEVAQAVARVLFVAVAVTDVAADDVSAMAVEGAPARLAFDAQQCHHVVVVVLALYNAPKCFDCR